MNDTILKEELKSREPVAHICDGNVLRPYPNVLCSHCRYKGVDLTTRDLCNSLISTRAELILAQKKIESMSTTLKEADGMFAMFEKDAPYSYTPHAARSVIKCIQLLRKGIGAHKIK